MTDIYYINPSSVDTDMRKAGAAIRAKAEKAGKTIQISFKLARRMKTAAQLAYYNILLRLLAKYCGYTDKKMDNTIKDNLGYYDEDLINGVERRIYKSKSKATIEEATIFVDTIMTLCDEMNIKYMLPKEYYASIGYKG